MTSPGGDLAVIQGKFQALEEERAVATARTQRRDEAIGKMSQVVVNLVDPTTHEAARQQLLGIICDTAGYAYALLAEVEPDGLHMRVTSVFAPEEIRNAFEAVTGFPLLGYRFFNDPAVVLAMPPTEIFDHISDYRPEIPRAAGTMLEQALGLRHLAAIRQQTADRYLGAVTFLATSDGADLEMLEYLCNNHLTHAVRLMSEQRRHEKAESLRSAEIKSLARFPEENPSPVMRILADGTLQYSNRPGRQMLAFAGFQTEGKCPVEWQPAIAQAIQTRQPVEIEFWAGQRIFACKIAPMLAGELDESGFGDDYVNLYALEITERKVAQEQLVASEVLKGAILESALDCIISIDDAGTVIEWNPAAEKTFGYSRDQVIGKPMHEFIVPYHMRPMHQAGMERYNRTGHGPVLGKRIEITGLHASGVEFPVELAITPVILEDRTVFTAYLRDISQRKDAEEFIKRSNSLLEAVTRAQSKFIRVIAE